VKRLTQWVANMSDSKSKVKNKLRSYRSARVGCLFLSVISGLVLLMLLVTGQTETQPMVPAYASTFFWPAMAYICHLKIKLLRVEFAAYS